MSAISTGSIRASVTRRPRSYVTRPAICLDRLTVRVDGKIQYELKNLFRRGRHRTEPPGRAVTYLVFSRGFPEQTRRTRAPTPT